MENFAVQFANYAAALGFAVPDDVEAVQNDNAVFQSIAATRLAVKNFDRSVADFLRQLTEGNAGEPLPVFPSEDFDAPPLDVPAGMFERIDDWRRRILAAPAYVESMGLAMGIVSSGSGNGLAPEDVKPNVELSAAMHGYLFSAVVSGRHGADAWQVWMRPGGLSEWQLLGTATGKSSDFTYSPGGEIPGPVVLEIYVQLRRSNQNYGQPSDIGLVTVNP